MQLQTVVDKSFEEIAVEFPEHGCWAVMCQAGDTKMIWDKRNPAEVAVAREQFRLFTEEHHYRAFMVDVHGNKDGEMVTEFDPEIQCYVFSPQIAGG